jgi:hypothetical protein
MTAFSIRAGAAHLQAQLVKRTNASPLGKWKLLPTVNGSVIATGALVPLAGGKWVRYVRGGAGADEVVTFDAGTHAGPRGCQGGKRGEVGREVHAAHRGQRLAVPARSCLDVPTRGWLDLSALLPRRCPQALPTSKLSSPTGSATACCSPG